MNNLTRIYTESPMLQAVVSTVVIYGGLAEGVGGAELREWLISGSEPVEDASGTAEAESAASDARIAELVRQRDAVLNAYDGLERDVEERYLRLPEDADGVPWHIGDVIEGHGELHCMSINCNGWTFTSSTAIDPSIHRHAKPDKLRELLQDMIHEYGCTDALTETIAGKYADEIRDLMGGEAV